MQVWWQKNPASLNATLKLTVSLSAGKIQNDDMDDKKFYEFLLAAYKGMYESFADGGSIYVS